MIFIKHHFLNDTNNLDRIETVIKENLYRFELLDMYVERAHIYHDYVMKNYGASGLATIMNSESYNTEFRKAMKNANKFLEMNIRLSKFQDMIIRIQEEALDFYNNTKSVLIGEIETYGDQNQENRD